MRLRRTRTLVADDHQVEPVDGGWVTSVRVVAPGQPARRLVLRLHDEVATPHGDTPIDTTATPFLPMLTMLAGAVGARLRLEAPVDAGALDGAARAAGLLREWFDWPALTVSAPTTTLPALPHRSAALFFSRGLDSTWSLFRGGTPVHHLVAIDWEDAPLASDGTRAIMRGTKAAAADLGLPLHRVSSNYRQFSDAVIGWDEAVGPTLASFSLLLSPLADQVIISATLPGHLMRPKGTHPDLDPLWSSSVTAVRHFGVDLGRCDKAAAVADEPFVQQWLKVCWERAGDGNCGMCPKCQMTMSNFEAVDRLGAVAARFDAPLSAEVVRTFGKVHVAPENLADVVEHLPDGELRQAWCGVAAQNGVQPG
ncbi:MAG: hypothetical protein RL238_191 [Actinomycetota bacterium]|jgi:hypothetical protein